MQYRMAQDTTSYNTSHYPKLNSALLCAKSIVGKLQITRAFSHSTPIGMWHCGWYRTFQYPGDETKKTQVNYMAATFHKGWPKLRTLVVMFSILEQHRYNSRHFYSFVTVGTPVPTPIFFYFFNWKQ